MNVALAFDRSKRYPSLPPRFGYEKSFAVVASSNRQKYRIKLNSSLSLFPFLAWFHETGEQVRSRRPGRPGGGWRTPKRRGAEVLAVPKGTKKKRVRSSVSSASIGRERERERERERKARVKLKSQQEGSWSVMARLSGSRCLHEFDGETRFAFFLRAFVVVERARAPQSTGESVES